ncbi:hypothetical protein ElyMa_007070400 [Elysia marginata]|uniref:Uncharacterized protein n=1 Tax=Elysia marginata TaxID=1093978 RepID=A0AAV4JVV1_9GAST|nr:hypothetical protein ElyMa_007070400 [Elysia marginata]
MAENPPQSPPIPFKMKTPRSHDPALTRGQTSLTKGKREGQDNTTSSKEEVYANFNNISIEVENESSMDDLNSSYYILEPHPDFSDYAPDNSEGDAASPASTPSAACTGTTLQQQQQQQQHIMTKQSPRVSPVALTSTPPICNVNPISTSPMSSPLLSDSLDYRRCLGQTYHRQFSHNQRQQHYHPQHQQQQQQHQQLHPHHHDHHHHRQYTRSKSEETGQSYYSVEDTIKVGACLGCSVVFVY